MDNYYITQSKDLDARLGNNQIIEYIPIEETGGKAHQTEEFSFGELWRRLMQRKWLLLSIAAGVFLVALVLTLLAPNIYRATTSLHVTAEDMRNLNFAEDDNVANRTPLSEREFYFTQTELLSSQKLVRSTIDSLGIASQFEKDNSLTSKVNTWFAGWKQKLLGGEVVATKNSVEENFQRHLSVAAVKDSQIFKISFDHEDPELAAKVVNTLADNYKQMNFDLRNERVAHAKETLSKKLEEAKKELETSEAKLVQYAKAQGIINVEGDRSAAAEVLTSLNQALTQAKDARIAAEAAYNRSKNVAGADRTLENPAVQRLKEELARVEAEYRDKASLFKPGFPEMQQLQGRISELQSKIAQEASSIDTTTRGRLKAEFDAAAQRETELKSEVRKQESLLMGQRDKSVDYNTLQRKVEADRRNYEGLLERLNEVRLAEDSGASNVAVVDKAQVPAKPYAPNVPLNLGMGAVLGLLLGLLTAVFADLMDDRIRSVEDMKRALGNTALLGVVPYISGRNNKNVLALRGRQSGSSSFMLEAFRSIREHLVMLKQPVQHGLAQVVSVTSSAPGEGKTTAAVNLATVFAYAEKKVLLIDCDMRHPESHNKLGIRNPVGVSDYLLGNKEFNEVVQESPVKNLYAITAGSAIPNPTELLASNRFAELLSEAEGMFDHVIIDTPPVMGLADALIVSNRAGNTLLVCAFGETRKRNLKDTYHRLSQAHGKIIGAVLTKMKSPEVSNKYYGYPSRYPRSAQTGLVATKSARI